MPTTREAAVPAQPELVANDTLTPASRFTDDVKLQQIVTGRVAFATQARRVEVERTAHSSVWRTGGGHGSLIARPAQERG